jgi:hypothetical protein
MVCGELGRYPMEVMVKRKIVLFWNNLLCESNKLSSILYKLMFKLHDQIPSHFKWISYVKSIFDDNALSFIWNDQIPMERNVLMFLQNCKCTFSIDSLFSKPHTSEVYNIIGLANESNSFN